MDKKTWSEHFDMERLEKAVQTLGFVDAELEWFMVLVLPELAFLFPVV